MAKIRKFVLGFLFNSDDTRVVLIEKLRPDWVFGLWNGVGGEVERDEILDAAMEREFTEETGLHLPRDTWREFACMTGNVWEVHMFESRVPDKVQARVRLTTDETVTVHDMERVRSDLPLVVSLSWIIPLALDRTKIYSHVQATRLPADPK